MLKNIADDVKERFFNIDMIPPYDENDIIEIIKYYASQSVLPQFYSFEKIDKNKLDVSFIAEHILTEKLDRFEEKEYIESLWNSTDENILHIFFSNQFDIFRKEIDNEINKQLNPKDEDIQNVIYGNKKIEELTMEQLKQFKPSKAKELREKIYKKSLNNKGEYVCQICGKHSTDIKNFNIDHIYPMNEGGLTVEDNLQLLFRRILSLLFSMSSSIPSASILIKIFSEE